MIPPPLIDIAVFVFGLLIGSFLNVCIVRIPQGQSIVLPPSACPQCGAKIRPYDNIPVLSWVILRGRCRHCKTRISSMYPVVELMTAFVFWACYRAFGVDLTSLKWAIFSAILILLVFTDLRERILPDVVNYGGFAVALALSLAMRPSDGVARWLFSFLFRHSMPVSLLSFTDALLGAAIGSGLLWTVSELYFRIRGREGMGRGDLKMMLMAGAFLGPQDTFLMILIGSLLGSVIGAIVIGSLYLGGWKKNVAMRGNRMGLGAVSALRCALVRRYQLPFGTYLGIGGLAVIFLGSPVVSWYESLLRVH